MLEAGGSPAFCETSSKPLSEGGEITAAAPRLGKTRKGQLHLLALKKSPKRIGEANAEKTTNAFDE
jgi:hypothetical protein